ncbi:MAG TPA: hypothetical protein VEC17_03260 [Candidatus Binatia bacterium]|nr:hypothetical protein [Candidatus Binatia bacterium]
MSDPKLVELIRLGLSHGQHPHELQTSPEIQKWTAEEFNQALGEVMLSVDEVPQGIQNTTTAQKGGFFSRMGWMARHKILASIIVFIGIALGTGFVFADSFFAPNINQVGGIIFKQILELDSVEYSGSLEAQVTTDSLLSLENVLKYGFQDSYPPPANIAGTQNTKIRIDFTGATDVKNIDQPKSEFSFTVSAEGYVIGLETKSIGKDLFFKLTQLPNLGIIDFKQYTNQWFQVDWGYLEKEAELNRNELTKEQKAKIAEIITNSNMVRVAEKLGSEDIEGVAAHHYRYTVDEAALLNAVEQIAEVVAPGTGGFTTMEKDQLLEWLNIQGGEIWISKKNFAPLKLTFNLTLQPSTDAPVSGNINLTFQMSKHNENLNIQPPTEFKSLQETIEKGLEDSRAQSRDARRLADIRQVMTALELYYNDNSTYPTALLQLSPLYISVIPTAPVELDGSCTAEQNTYLYKPASNRRDYVLTFCLGADTSGFSAGPKTASSQGIE